MGFWAIHLCGVAVGRAIASDRRLGVRRALSRAAPRARARARAHAPQAARAAAFAVAAAAAAQAAAGRPSRRAADAPYATWVAAHNALLLLATQLVQGAFAGPLPPLLQALSGRHAMLATFLAANLLTGCVNLGVDTLRVGDGAAAALLAGYMCAVCAAGPWLARAVSGG